MKRKTTPKKKSKKSKNNVVRLKITSPTQTVFSNRISPSHIPPTRIKSSWKSISQSTLQPFGGTKVSMTCFLELNGMISGMWAIYSQRVYRNPIPTHIDAVMRRLRDEVRNTDPNTLIRLCHELPAKMNEVFRLKGKKIPSNFDPRKSQFACKCKICSS